MCHANSGQPKGLSFGFRPKVSVSASAEMFRQKIDLSAERAISAERAYFGRNSLLSAAFGTILWPILNYFSRKKVISAEIPSFCCFRLSAEIADTISVDHLTQISFHSPNMIMITN